MKTKQTIKNNTINKKNNVDKTPKKETIIITDNNKNNENINDINIMKQKYAKKQNIRPTPNMDYLLNYEHPTEKEIDTHYKIWVQKELRDDLKPKYDTEFSRDNRFRDNVALEKYRENFVKPRTGDDYIEEVKKENDKKQEKIYKNKAKHSNNLENRKKLFEKAMKTVLKVLELKVDDKIIDNGFTNLINLEQTQWKKVEGNKDKVFDGSCKFGLTAADMHGTIRFLKYIGFSSHTIESATGFDRKEQTKWFTDDGKSSKIKKFPKFKTHSKEKLKRMLEITDGRSSLKGGSLKNIRLKLSQGKDGFDISSSTLSRWREKYIGHGMSVKARLIMTKDHMLNRLAFTSMVEITKLQGKEIMFTDEKIFTMDSDSYFKSDHLYINKWAKYSRRKGEDLGLINELASRNKAKFGQSFMVSAGITYYGVTPLIFCCGTMDTDAYKDTLDYFMKDLNNFREKYNAKLFFQQDGATCHTSHETMRYLKEEYGEVPILWPPISADLSPIETVWSVVGQKLYSKGPFNNLLEMKSELQKIWASIPVEYCRNLINTFDHKCGYVRKTLGKQYFNNTKLKKGEKEEVIFDETKLNDFYHESDRTVFNKKVKITNFNFFNKLNDWSEKKYFFNDKTQLIIKTAIKNFEFRYTQKGGHQKATVLKLLPTYFQRYLITQNTKKITGVLNKLKDYKKHIDIEELLKYVINENSEDKKNQEDNDGKDIHDDSTDDDVTDDEYNEQEPIVKYNKLVETSVTNLTRYPTKKSMDKKKRERVICKIERKIEEIDKGNLNTCNEFLKQKRKPINEEEITKHLENMLKKDYKKIHSQKFPEMKTKEDMDKLHKIKLKNDLDDPFADKEIVQSQFNFMESQRNKPVEPRLKPTKESIIKNISNIVNEIKKIRKDKTFKNNTELKLPDYSVMNEYNIDGDREEVNKVVNNYTNETIRIMEERGENKNINSSNRMDIEINKNENSNYIIENKIKLIPLKNFVEKKIPGDGNCFFNCIKKSIIFEKNIEPSLIEMRNVVSNLILCDDSLDQFMVKEGRSKYADEIKNDGYGGPIDCMALCNEFSIWIAILNTRATDNKWEIIKPHKDVKPKGFIFLKFEGSKNDVKELSGHYNHIYLPENEDFPSPKIDFVKYIPAKKKRNIKFT